MARKSASGTGSIRKHIVHSNGKEYTYWEARYTNGTDPGTGRQLQPSISGSTQKEVSRRLKEVTAAIDKGSHVEPCRMPLSDWLTEWSDTYLKSQKPLTIDKYRHDIEKYISPGIGAVQLRNLNTQIIQTFYNSLTLSPKSVKNIHGVLHKALQQAVAVGYLERNPSDYVVLPKAQKYDFKVLSPKEIGLYCRAAEQSPIGDMLIFTLFSGLRRGEVMGLSWDCVSFATDSIIVKQQLQYQNHVGWSIAPTKSGKERKIYVAPVAMECLRREKLRQLAWQQENLDYFSNTWNLCFTDESGQHLSREVLRDEHKAVLASAGLPDIRLHDLRHSYAVTALQAGDDIKTLQENMGHATASFTLDVYATALDDMKRNSASRMQSFFDDVITGSKPDKGKNKGKNSTRRSRP